MTPRLLPFLIWPCLAWSSCCLHHPQQHRPRAQRVLCCRSNRSWKWLRLTTTGHPSSSDRTAAAWNRRAARRRRSVWLGVLGRVTCGLNITNSLTQTSEQGARRRTPRRRRAERRQPPVLDDADSMQIKGREYREWMEDRSQVVLAPLGSVPTPGDGSRGVGAGLQCTLLPAGFEHPVPATALCPGGGWPPELLALFSSHTSMLAATACKDVTGAGSNPTAAPSSECGALWPLEHKHAAASSLT